MMVGRLKAYQEKHMDYILEQMAEFKDRYRRFNGIFTAVMFYGDVSSGEDEIKKMIRITDRYIRLEDDLILLVFGETAIEGGIIAAEKVLSRMLDSPQKRIYAAAVEYEKPIEDSLLVHRLFNIIEYAIEHKHINEVMDSSYLDGLY